MADTTPNPPTPTIPPPPAAPADPPDPNAKPISAFVRRLTENTAIQPVVLEEKPIDTRSLHQRLSEIQVDLDKKEEAAVDPPAPDTGTAAKSGTAPAAPAPVLPPVKKSRLIKIDKASSTAPVPSAPAPAAVPEPTKPASAEPAKGQEAKDPNEGLSETQIDRIQLLEFAEAAHSDKYKGKSAEFREYFKKEAEFQEKNPDALESDARDFMEAHMPKLSQFEIKRLENEMLLDMAEKRAEERLKPKLTKIEDQLNRAHLEKQAQPIVEQAVTKLRDAMLDAEAEVPGGYAPVFAPIARLVKEKGEAAAATQYPIEYPILNGTLAAAEEYMKIINGLVPFNNSNPVHSWLSQFQSAQEQRIASDQVLSKRNGKTFVPQYDFAEMQRTEPNKAAGHFTVEADDILNAMVVHAHQVADQEIKRLEAAGFRRAAVDKSQQPDAQTPAEPTPPPPAPTPTPEPTPSAVPAPAPRAGGSRFAGAAAPAPAKPKGLFSRMMAEN